MIDSSVHDAAVAATAHKFAVGGGSGAVLGWLMSNDFVGIAGLIIGAIGLCVQIYYRRRADARDAQATLREAAALARSEQREIEFHNARMAGLMESREEKRA